MQDCVRHVVRYGVVGALLTALIACGGGGADTKTVSAGLKIFVTAETHNGDFANDPTLTGSAAMQKADDFCNRSASKPSSDNYKALLVDGVGRDAVSPTDWVLRANTAYYQAFDNVLIDTTTDRAIFAAFFRSMQNRVLPSCSNCSSPGAWTGIGDGATFAASTINNCARWGQTSSVVQLNGSFGSPTATDGFAFYSAGSSAECASVSMSLYCVQQ
jgi:Protein of unknown function (DUF1554)